MQFGGKHRVQVQYQRETHRQRETHKMGWGVWVQNQSNYYLKLPSLDFTGLCKISHNTPSEHWFQEEMTKGITLQSISENTQVSQQCNSKWEGRRKESTLAKIPP